MKQIQETPAMRGINRYGVPFEVMDIRRQIVVLVDTFGAIHKDRPKATGHTTKKFRAHIVNRFVSDVQEAGYKIRSLMKLDQRHIQAAITVWRERKLAPATIQTRLSVLRWLTRIVGKAGMVLPAKSYGLLPEEIKRLGVAQEDKSWSPKGSIPEELIEKARAEDRWVAAQLSMMRAFGLRVTEAILIRPRSSHIGDVLKVEEGTKGGRTRIVPIRTEEQLLVLEACKILSLESNKGALVQPDKTPEQSRWRLYYICKKIGITKAQLSITPHGLRHEYANDLYEEISGTPSVVRGSSEILENAAEEAARRAVSEDLGHKRLRITGAYTGPSKKMTNVVRKHLGTLCTTQRPVCQCPEV